MLKVPSNSVLVALSQLKLNQIALGSRKSIEKNAKGVFGDKINFKDYQVCLAEQDEPDTLIQMIQKIDKTNDCKAFAKKGWVDYRRIKSIFDTKSQEDGFLLKLAAKIQRAV